MNQYTTTPLGQRTYDANGGWPRSYSTWGHDFDDK